MATEAKKFSDGIVRPQEALKQRVDEAETAALDTSNPAQGVNKGDIPGPNVDFFKPRDRSKDKEGLAKALKKRGF